MNTYIQTEISKFRDLGFKREFIDLQKIANEPPFAIWNNQKVNVWCTNDYLGMSFNNDIANAITNCIKSHGSGSGGSRNIAGNSHHHIELEKRIAKLHKQEKACLFTSAYIANEAVFSLLGKVKDSVFFSDELIHASIISGLKKGCCNTKIFKHNDIHCLRKLLQNENCSNKFIIVESVYSMDGDFAPLLELSRLASEFNAQIILDEVNGVGLYGKKGAGVSEQLKIQNDIAIIIGTFGKAYGLSGGYIASSELFIDYLQMFSKEFIFTTSLPTCIVAGAIESINLLANNNKIRIQHKKIIKKVVNKLTENDFELASTDSSHILPVLIPGVDICKKFSKILLAKYDIYIQPVFYPSVAKGKERIRITPTPYHNDNMIENLISAMNMTRKELSA
jgi:5-aminolevulinate synthase